MLQFQYLLAPSSGYFDPDVTSRSRNQAFNRWSGARVVASPTILKDCPREAHEAIDKTSAPGHSVALYLDLCDGEE